MPDVVRVSGPARLHLRKEVGLEDALRFADGCFDRFGFLSVQLTVAGPIKAIEIRGNRIERLLLRRVGLV